MTVFGALQESLYGWGNDEESFGVFPFVMVNFILFLLGYYAFTEAWQSIYIPAMWIFLLVVTEIGFIFDKVEYSPAYSRFWFTVARKILCLIDAFIAWVIIRVVYRLFPDIKEFFIKAIPIMAWIALGIIGLYIYIKINETFKYGRRKAEAKQEKKRK